MNIKTFLLISERINVSSIKKKKYTLLSKWLQKSHLVQQFPDRKPIKYWLQSFPQHVQQSQFEWQITGMIKFEYTKKIEKMQHLVRSTRWHDTHTQIRWLIASETENTSGTIFVWARCWPRCATPISHSISDERSLGRVSASTFFVQSCHIWIMFNPRRVFGHTMRRSSASIYT